MRTGVIRLFRFAGIDVYLHFTWFLVAAFEMTVRTRDYQSRVWNVAEYLTLFGIVLLHEFGHAFACRQVGGVANRIVLWPLGGIAYVNPPPRPGAVLWSIAAGPLVNVALVPITLGLYVWSGMGGHDAGDLPGYLQAIYFINLGLLLFNLLPIYPLDGGQIVQALLWFVLGRARSLLVVSIVGLAVGLGTMGLALSAREFWLGIVALFVAWRSWAGFQQGLALARRAKAPRHEGLACPSCHTPPLKGPYWLCNQCRHSFDTFEHGGVCPECDNQFAQTMCPECHQR